MIHHFDQKHVSANTTATENLHISKDRYLAIEAENRELKQEIAKLQQRCEVLHNCWQAAVCSYNESQEQIRELEQHLNPPEAA